MPFFVLGQVVEGSEVVVFGMHHTKASYTPAGIEKAEQAQTGESLQKVMLKECDLSLRGAK